MRHGGGGARESVFIHENQWGFFCINFTELGPVIKDSEIDRKGIDSVISVQDATFSVVDVETTGSTAYQDKIIEFAAFKVRKGKIVDQYSTLVNPGRHIPNFIQNMTGITGEMTFGAPGFGRIARDISQFLEGSIFTAHNSQFDYGFVKNEMKNVGMDFDMPQLCTRKLSSRMFPDLPRKALDHVCRHLGISISGRHRAYGDARATAHLLIELLELISERHEIVDLDELLRFQNVPRRIDPHRNQNVFKKAMMTVSNSPGVYKVFGSAGDIIYVGKAKNIKLRMASYLTENAKDADKVRRMLSNADHVQWEVTASELHAFLRELQLIRELKPSFNSLLVHSRRFPFIKLSADKKFDRLDLVYELDDDGRYYGPFQSSYIAEQILYAADKYFKLVKCDDDFIKPFDPCLYFYIDRCSAPCRGDISEDEYTREVDAVEEFLSGAFGKLTTELQSKLDELTKRLEFENAAEIRDMMEVLERTSLHLKLLEGPVSKVDFLCGWGTEAGYELYRVKMGLVTGPVVVTEEHLQSGVDSLLANTEVVTSDFVPLRILLSFAMEHPAGFFRVRTGEICDGYNAANKIKAAVGKSDP